jgi:hypothetical protein
MDYLRNEEKKESIESERIARKIVDEIFSINLSHDLYRIKNTIRNS